MLKPSGLIMLIIALLGIGYFLQGGGCDGSVLLGDSGPDIPPGNGLEWLDTGNGWISLDDNNPEAYQAAYEISGWLGYDVICDINEINKYNFINLSGNQIRYGLRFDPMTALSETKSVGRLIAQQTKVYPLVEEHSYRGDLYVLDSQDATPVSAGSDIREDKEYIYLEFNNIPPSPTGMYAFTMDGTHVILLKN